MMKLIEQFYLWLGEKLRNKEERDHRKAQKICRMLERVGIDATTGDRVTPPSRSSTICISKASLDRWAELRGLKEQG